LTKLIDEAILILKTLQKKIIEWKTWDHRDRWSIYIETTVKMKWKRKQIESQWSKSRNEWRKESTNHQSFEIHDRSSRIFLFFLFLLLLLS
jgi:hypothetical protein